VAKDGIKTVAKLVVEGQFGVVDAVEEVIAKRVKVSSTGATRSVQGREEGGVGRRCDKW
jgi:hypothetical protein